MLNSQPSPLLRMLVVALVAAAVFGPVAALQHGLEHLEERLAASSPDHEGCPAGDDESGQCDFCSAFANARAAVASMAGPVPAEGAWLRRIDVAPAVLAPPSLRDAPASPRAPPLG